MSETWKQWEGQTVNGEFPLLAYLGGSRHSAVFVTRRKSAPERAAIKLIRADDSGAESQLHRWKKSSELSHPNLIRIFESGRCEIDSTPLLYVVLEIAEEDLSQILPERALSPDEVRQLLPPVLATLEHLHSKGMVHGRVRPSNIQASGDEVKVSADTLRVSGERVAPPEAWSANDPPESSSDRLTPAADVWSLAVTLVQALTQQRPLWHPSEPGSPSLPETTPEPFREIARRCLQLDPAQRWTIAEIKTALQPKTARPAPVALRPPVAEKRQPGSAKSSRLGWIVGLAAAAVVLALIMVAAGRHGGSAASNVAQPSEKASAGGEQSNASVEPKPNPALTSPARTSKSRRGAESSSLGAGEKGAVLHQATPQVSSSARQTLQGKLKVAVRVDVDSSGNVTAAKLTSPGPSKYFSRIALEAAREWKFTPPQLQSQAVPSQWTLQFGFRRSGTEVISRQTSP